MVGDLAVEQGRGAAGHALRCRSEWESAAGCRLAAVAAPQLSCLFSLPSPQPVLGRPVSRSNRGSMIMVNVTANAASGGVGSPRPATGSPRPGTPRLVPKQD